MKGLCKDCVECVKSYQEQVNQILDIYHKQEDLISEYRKLVIKHVSECMKEVSQPDDCPECILISQKRRSEHCDKRESPSDKICDYCKCEVNKEGGTCCGDGYCTCVKEY